MVLTYTNLININVPLSEMFYYAPMIIYLFFSISVDEIHILMFNSFHAKFCITPSLHSTSLFSSHDPTQLDKDVNSSSVNLPIPSLLCKQLCYYVYK